MRCAPIGLWARDERAAAEAADRDAALTHPNPVCRAASASFAAAISVAVRGGDRQAMLEAARGVLRERNCRELLQDTADALQAPPTDFLHRRGWVRIGWRNAFHHLAVGTPLEQALIETVAEGGDTDTNAAICGALLGAAQGRLASPLRWTTRILSCRPLEECGAHRPRPPQYWSDDLPMLAEALLLRQRSPRPQ